MQPKPVFVIGDDIAYFTARLTWLQNNLAQIPVPNRQIAWPAALRLLVVPPELSQIKLQSADNPALYMAPIAATSQQKLFSVQMWNDDLQEWATAHPDPSGLNPQPPVIVPGSTILARGHIKGIHSLTGLDLCTDAGVVWHEAGHAISVQTGIANTEGYAYEFELYTLAFAVQSNAIAQFGFTCTDIVVYLETLRIGQFVSYSAGQKPQVHAALNVLRAAIGHIDQHLATRIDPLLLRLT